MPEKKSGGDAEVTAAAATTRLGDAGEETSSSARPRDVWVDVVTVMEILAAQRETLGARNPLTVATTVALALQLQGAGCEAAAEQLLRKALEAQRELHGARHPRTLATGVKLLSLQRGLAAAAASDGGIVNGLPPEPPST